MSSIAVSVEGIDLVLLAKRGLFWPEHKTLFIADTHLGKEATFRSQGVPVPRGITIGTLETIAQMISECQANRLILLGDMFHAPSSVSQDIRDSLDIFFKQHSQLRFTLVRGNHDRNVCDLPTLWPIEIVDSGSQLGNISVSHFPRPPSDGTDLLLCGHLHPAYRFPCKTDNIGRLACFWLSSRQLVLPAIGEFTGAHVIKPSPSDRTWVIAENRIFEVIDN